MSYPTRRGRARAATDKDIRRTARALLVEQGPEAVTLRAIARELGITAPALYRYYESRDDLLENLRLDVVSDLAAELGAQIAELPDDGTVRLFAICKGFRQWALSHTKEFTLVFASQSDSPSRFDEPFGRIFLSAMGRLLVAQDIITPAPEAIPPQLRDDLLVFQAELLSMLSESEPRFPVEKLDLSVMYLMIQFWARLYGHVTLEVFGNYPMPVSQPDILFEAALADLARQIGIVPAP
jgi:AcrR family transcriptional regulator